MLDAAGIAFPAAVTSVGRTVLLVSTLPAFAAVGAVLAGHRLRVVVVASNADGSASAASPATAPVGATGVYRAASSSHSKGARAKVSAGT